MSTTSATVPTTTPATNPSSTPATMTAVRFHRYGGPGVLTVEDVPVPVPGPGEVLVRVESASVNFSDVMRRRADPYPFPTPLPFTPGSEFAGTVEALGEGVDGPPVGTPVFALGGETGSGGYAQFAVAAAPRVAPVPPGMSADEACALLVAGTTATLTLTDVARLQPGESVLVPAAGGAVGLFAVQVAKALGAGTVIGAAGTAAKRDRALAAGADHVVDSTRDDWAAAAGAAAGGPLDVVLEVAGGADFDRALSCLAPFGRLVVVGVAGGEPLTLTPEASRRFFYDPAPNQVLTGFNVGAYFALRPAAAGAALQRLVGMILDGRVQVPVGSVLPLWAAADAHRALEAREAVGKVVLRPWEA